MPLELVSHLLDDKLLVVPLLAPTISVLVPCCLDSIPSCKGAKSLLIVTT